MPSPLFLKTTAKQADSPHNAMYNAVSLRVAGQHTLQQSLSKINPKYLLNTVCTLTSPPSPILEVQQWIYATINPDSIIVPEAKLSP